MPYCEKCSRLFDASLTICEECGRNLQEPLENDPVLLFESGVFYSNMVEPLLKDMKIPYSRQSTLGVGFTMWAGSVLEKYKFFVPFCVYPMARELLETTFGEDPAIMEEIR